MNTKQCRSCSCWKPLSEYYPRSPDCKVCKSIKNKEDYKNNKDKHRDKLYRSNYGITLEDYNQMFAEQQGCCAICGVHQSEEKRALAVDHCHKTGKVRGLLCNNCNTGIGKLKDDYRLLESGAAYLRRAEARFQGLPQGHLGTTRLT